MKVVFVSNFLNHFTLPLCENLVKYCEDFKFVATSKVSQVAFRQEISADYVLHIFNEKEKIAAQQAIVDADVTIFGDGADSFMESRMTQNKLSFVFSERLFKRGTFCADHLVSFI